MKIERLDHVNVRTANLDKMVAWYETILGMKSGKRPDFSFPGAWLYIGDRAMVHLVGVEAETHTGAGSQANLKLEHFAFRASGFKQLAARLEAAGERYDTAPLPGIDITQVNIWDPDRNHIHIDFPSSEVE